MFPIISAASLAIAYVIDKLILNKFPMTSKDFTSILFVFMSLFCLPLIFFSDFKDINLLLIWALLLTIILSALQNYLLYVSLNNRDLSALQPINNSEPIVIALSSFIIFPDERNPLILLLVFITTITVILSSIDFKKWSKNKIKFDKYALILIGSVFISALTFILYKYTLSYISPVTLYVIRVFWVTILLYLLFKPKLSSLNKWKSSLIWMSALFYSLSAITQYFAISKVGIIMTVLSLALMPIIVYFSSYFILKEKVTITQIISSIIIMSCVFTAAIFS